jgi:hypothetical protein
MEMDMPALRGRLEKEGLTLGEYLVKRRFPYLWADEGGLSGELGRWIRENYEEVFSYEFTERPATFRFSIHRLRPGRPGAL